MLLKKLFEGDCTWSTFQVLLGWVVYMVNMMLYLTPHREKRFKEIMAGIPIIQKQISVEKRHWVLGELLFMDIALPGARGVFSHMQEALGHL